MRQRSVYTEYWLTAGAEKQAGKQAAALNSAGKISTACVEPSKRNKEAVGGNVPVTAKNSAFALPEIGYHHDVCLVITGAGLEPCLPLAHFIGRSHVCISVSGPNLQATEFVDQEEVDHTSDGVGSIHSRGAIFKDVYVIDHRKRYQVNVRAAAKSGNAQRTVGDAFAVY